MVTDAALENPVLGLARNFRFGIIVNVPNPIDDLLGLARNFRFGIIASR